MRIVFCGLPLAALLLLEDGHAVPLAAICRRSAIGTRRLKRKLGEESVLVTPNLSSPAVVERIRALEPDLLVSWFWTKRIPRAVLEIPRFGAVGVHPSLLPRHRGPDPYFWAIRSGDAVTGVTAHRLEEEYDTGGIYGQRSLTLDPSWNAWTLARRLDRPSLSLLRETVARFAREGAISAAAQDESRVTSAPEPGEDELELHWDDDAETIARYIRAAAPSPGMITEIGDRVVFVTRAEPTDDVPRALVPGEAAVVNGFAVVRTRDRGVRLLAAQDEEDVALGPGDLAALVEQMIVSPSASDEVASTR
jgi:methionyl-tRNA formyltransferase